MASLSVIPVFPRKDEASEQDARVIHEYYAALTKYAVRHRLSDSVEAADILLFHIAAPCFGNADPWRRSLRSHPLFKKFKDRSVILDRDDRALPLAKGLYGDIHAAWFNQRKHGAAPYVEHYLWNGRLDPPLDRRSAVDGNEQHLFSFVGDVKTDRRTRGRVLTLQHPRAFLRNTSGVNPWKDTDRKERWRTEYAAAIHRSKFVLCPRGLSTSTIRVYEVMRAGKVPVIIADGWMPPPGPDWQSFSVRVAEQDIERIPALLEKLEPEAEAMGARARQNWEDWFSEAVLFDRLVDWCLAIRDGSNDLTVRERLLIASCILGSRDRIRRILPSRLVQFFRALHP
jgi:hypothetical protein